MKIKIITYKKQWDFHIEYHFLMIQGNEYISSGCIEESKAGVVIKGVYVNEKYRNKGYGKKLFNKIMKQVNSVNYDEVWLMVKKDNPVAISMYKKHNFKISKSDDTGIYYWMKLKN